ncbi:nuclear transport factor 2 family protein [Vibrio sp.]|uniref:nuclear transport factor 2 family protein n=1 Tax=Vibrio sp. TaxID=678 RepID=UPI003D10A5BB
MSLSEIVSRGWDSLGRGDFDALVSDYTDDMVFIMPGQNDALNGRHEFRSVLDNLAVMLPPGFEITQVRQLEGQNEVVSLVDWKSATIDASQLAILFKFKGNKIYEERWFIDTVQWQSAFN